MPDFADATLVPQDLAQVNILAETRECRGQQSSLPTSDVVAEIAVMATSLYGNEAARAEPGALAAVFQIVNHRPPVFVIRFHDEPLTEANFSAYLSQLEALYETEEPFVLVMDLARLRWPPLAFFWKQVAFLREHYEDMRRCVLWSVLVVERPDMRVLLQLLFTIVPPQRPFHVLDTTEMMQRQAEDLSAA